MIFNSVIFWVFFALVFVVYRVMGHRAQNRWLLIASYVFYGYWDWRFLTLLAFTTTVDFFVSKTLARTDDSELCRRLLILSVVSNLSVLGFFKYAGFFVASAQSLLEHMGWQVPAWQLQLVLPVGISFYTFQSMSYTIDVYRRNLVPADSWMDYALYVSFFPQLVAGPIERATHLLHQVREPRCLAPERWPEGIWLIIWGLFKKVVIADNLAGYADAVFQGSTPLNTMTVLIGIYAFAIQIYCDFSGYSDMARGLARLLGFDLMLNFWNPYFAQNPSDFWRRWHISLSTWLRDYLYIPLGGNRGGMWLTYRNLFLTMLLGGLWHGAAWNFVLWGAYQGLLLIAHRAWCRTRGGGDATTSRVGLQKIMAMVVMFHFTCLGWLFFRADSLEQINAMLQGLLVLPSFVVSDYSPWLGLFLLSAPLGFVQLYQEKTGDPWAPMRLSLCARIIFTGGLLLGIFVLGNIASPAFIYFQF